MLNAGSVYRRVAILHSLQPERPITIKIHVRSSSSPQCKLLPRVPHAESSFPGLNVARASPKRGNRLLVVNRWVARGLSFLCSARL